MSKLAPSFLTESGWEMGLGERAAIAGVLSQLRPSISIELGTYRGGSLGTIAAYSGQVHTFDLTLQVERDEHPNVTFHVGDSHKLLPQVLAELEANGRTAEFALVDGDHSPDGVRRDVLDLLASDAMSSGAIVLHDTGNEAVRRGIESIPFARYPRLALVELDFVPARVPRGRLSVRWGGLGLMVLDQHRSGPGAVPGLGGHRDPWIVVRELRQQTRRATGLALRRAGLHPTQLRAHDRSDRRPDR